VRGRKWRAAPLAVAGCDGLAAVSVRLVTMRGCVVTVASNECLKMLSIEPKRSAIKLALVVQPQQTPAMPLRVD